MNAKAKITSTAKTIIRLIFLFGISVIILYPLFYSFSVAIREPEDLYDPLVILVPRHFTWENIANVMERMNYWPSLLGSVFRDGISCVLQLFSRKLLCRIKECKMGIDPESEFLEL